MKRNIFKKLFAVLIALHVYIYAEDTAYLSKIDNFTLQEVKEYLVNDQKSMEKFIKFAENSSLRFFVSSAETTRPSFNNEPYVVLDANESSLKIDTFLLDMYMRQQIDYPKSAVLMNLDSYKMEDIFGVEESVK